MPVICGHARLCSACWAKIPFRGARIRQGGGQSRRPGLRRWRCCSPAKCKSNEHFFSPHKNPHKLLRKPTVGSLVTLTRATDEPLEALGAAAWGGLLGFEKPNPPSPPHPHLSSTGRVALGGRCQGTSEAKRSRHLGFREQCLHLLNFLPCLLKSQSDTVSLCCNRAGTRCDDQGQQQGSAGSATSTRAPQCGHELTQLRTQHA